MVDPKTNWNDWLTPDLAHNPSLAYDVSKSSNPNATAPVVSHTYRTVATQDAVNDHIAENGSNGFWDKVGHTALTGLEKINYGLKEIQRDYKFIHSVYTKHSFLEGFAVTLGVIGGGIGGAVVGGLPGAIVGADAAAILARKAAGLGPLGDIYKDSLEDSANENYIVSSGRNFSNALAKASDAVGLDAAAKAFRNTDVGLGKGTSGFADTVFNINTDPVLVLSYFGMAMRGGKLLKLDEAGEIQAKYPLYKVIPGAKKFITERSGRVLTSEQMDAVREGSTSYIGLNQTARTYNRAIEDIANLARTSKTSAEAAGNIVTRYPALGTDAAGHLSGMKTADDVHEFLKSVLYFGEKEGTLAGSATLPSRTALRAKLGDKKVSQILSGKEATLARYVLDPSKGVFVENPEWKKLSLKRLGSSVYNTFTGYMPYSVDAKTLKLSTSEFRWNAPDAATVIYRIGKFGMGEQAAKLQAGKYAEAVVTGDINLARIIKNETIFETFKSMGLPDDAIFVKSIKDELDKLSSETISGQIYGVKPNGETIGKFATANGPKQGGIWEHQATEMFKIPNFVDIKSALRDAGRLTKTVGQLDEIIATRYTNKIFKPLALATAGFGLRIAASEMIPTISRYGFINTFKASLGKSAAKANYEVIPEERKHILSAVLIALGAARTGVPVDVMNTGFTLFKDAAKKGLVGAAKLTAAEQLELATRLILTHSGHIINEAVSTGHGFGQSANHDMERAANYFYQIKKGNAVFKDLPDYTTYQAENPYYPGLLTTSYNKAARNKAEQNISLDLLQSIGKKVKLDIDPTAIGHQEYLDLREQLIQKELMRIRDTKLGTYNDYKSESKLISRWKDGDNYEFASDRVDAVLGKLVGQDGTIQKTIAKNIVNGKETSIEQITAIQLQSPLSLPKMTEGPILLEGPTKSYYQRIIDGGFKKVVDPIINNLARENLYMLHVADEYAYYIPRVKAGQITEDQALRYAEQRAVYAMLPQIHNVALRSQFATFARNILPFYFAQEQAIKRAYATLKDTRVGSPVFSKGLRYYQIAEQTLNDPGFVQTDDKGGRYLTLPGIGEFGQAAQNALAAYGIPVVANLPITAVGNLTSLKTVLPELQPPGVTPFVSIELNAIAKFLPFTRPIAKAVLGDIGYRPGFQLDSTVDALIPATWAKNVFRALTLDEQDRQVSNAIAAALATAYYHEQIPGQKDGIEPDPIQQQEFLNKIKNNVRSVLMLKAAMNLLSPLAPRITQEDPGLSNEFWKLVKSEGNYTDAMMKFIEKHGASAISYTVAKSESRIPDVKYPYVKQTVDFINTNNDKFSDPTKSTGYYFLIPQKTEEESSYEVFNELVDLGLRKTRQPLDLIRQFYIAQGEYAISEERKNHYARLDQYKANFDTYSQQVENKNWSKTMNDMKTFFPIWYDENAPGKSANANATKAYNQLNAIFADPKTAPKHEQALAVKKLLDAYNAHASTMKSYKDMSINGYLPTAEKERFKDYLLSLAEKQPELKTVIYGVFNKLG
jgi:hypothetical protein